MLRHLLVTGAVRPDGRGNLLEHTGGTFYDYMVARKFESEGWSVGYFHVVADLPYIVHRPRFPANLAMIARFRKSAPDLVLADAGGHRHTWLFNRWVRKNRGSRTIATAFHMSFRSASTRLGRIILRWTEKDLLTHSDLVVSISDHTSSELGSLGVDPARVILARPGLSVSRSPGPRISDDVRTVLLVGTVEPRKGVLEAVEALSRSGADRAKLLIVGKPDYNAPYAAMVRERIRQLGMQERVEFLGMVDQAELERLYSASDIFLLPSRWEGYGMAIAEAMARGLPVVATAVGAVPELVKDGVNGLLVEPRDTGGLADAISTLSADVQLRRRISGAAYETSLSFPTWEETCATIYDAAMSRLFADKGAGPG
ncbi:glycosyltransferase family 4 protein [Candidatus Fermentibacterales bacterium]|nr:glycosyltransferase family 4 protein [Candidatus Fermentibacterales bacterium]